jgi:hypothetical protein
MPFMYCDPPARVAHIRPATDQSHAGSGMVTLANGAWFEISVPGQSPQGDFVVKLRKGDRIQMCYGPAQTWADEPANARMAIVGDLENQAYFYGTAMPAGK